MAETESAPNEPVATKRRRRDYGVLALMGIAALAATAGFGMLFSLWVQSRPPDRGETLRLASERFIAGERTLASNLAKRVELDPNLPEQARLISLREFLIGAGKSAEAAEAELPSERRERLFEAIPHLERARRRGFPAGRQADGQRLLGDALHGLGRFDEAVEAFRSAIDHDRTLRRSLAPRLAESLLRGQRERAGEALETIEAYLDEPTLEVPRRRRGQLIRIEALMALRRWSDAEAAIADAMRSTSEALPAQPVKPGQLDATGFRERLQLQQAELRVERTIDRLVGPEGLQADSAGAPPEVFREVLARLNELQRWASPQIAARTRLLAARAYLAQGDADLALAQLMLVRQQRPFGGEGIAGGLIEIELLARQGRGDEAVQTARYMIRELGDPKGYDGSLVPLAEFKRRLKAALETLRSKEQFASAIDVARVLPPVFGATESLLEEGTGFRRWAEATEREATAAGGRPSAMLTELARQRYRAAADAFAAAAGEEFTSEQYPALLWEAIEAYQLAGHFERSIELLEPYLRYEERTRKPRGLIALGRALLATGGRANYERAIANLGDCIEQYARDPLRYDARLLAAQAHAELGQMQPARRLLEDNLRDGELTPSSPAWRMSLLTLGELLHQRVNANQLRAEHALGEPRRRLLVRNRQLIEDALRHLHEAVQRYWPPEGADEERPSPRVLHAAYLAAETHRMAAQLRLIDEEAQNFYGLNRRQQNQQALSDLQEALARYRRLSRHLENRLDESGDDESLLHPQELALLRNCLMGEADTLYEIGSFDPGRYEDANVAYQAVTARYMSEPLALEGILGQVKCLRKLGRDGEADARIRQAQVVLGRISEEWNDEFDRVTRYDREGWQRLLAWLNETNPAGA